MHRCLSALTRNRPAAPQSNNNISYSSILYACGCGTGALGHVILQNAVTQQLQEQRRITQDALKNHCTMIRMTKQIAATSSQLLMLPRMTPNTTETLPTSAAACGRCWGRRSPPRHLSSVQPGSGLFRRDERQARRRTAAVIPRLPPGKTCGKTQQRDDGAVFQTIWSAKHEHEAQRGREAESEGGKKPFGESTEEKIKLHLGGKFYQGIVIVSWQLLSIWVISRRDWFNKRNLFPSEMIFSNPLIEPDPSRVKTRR